MEAKETKKEEKTGVEVKTSSITTKEPISEEPKMKTSSPTKTRSPIIGFITSIINAIRRVNPLRIVSEFHKKAKETVDKSQEIEG